MCRPRRLAAPVIKTTGASDGESGKVAAGLGMVDNQEMNMETPSVSDASTSDQPPTLGARLRQHMGDLIAQAGGWLAFDAFMNVALYTPALGYYAHGSQKFGHLPQSGSDFVTAPELSPIFGACVGEQVAQALQATQSHHVYEFGAGSGALALQICELLTHNSYGFKHYFIMEISASLRARQQEMLKAFAGRVTWLDALPERIDGVVVANELLDALPVKLLVRKDGVWHERGVVAASAESGGTPALKLQFADRVTDLRPPMDIAGEHDYLTEIHPQANALVQTLAERMGRAVILLIDYGFPESEYYHPERHMGTLMCHFQHQADPDPLDKIGQKDITAHVNFTGVALAAQDAGLQVLGYTSQGRFLMNCKALSKMELLAHIPRANAAKLLTEHEMGELFKVLMLGKNTDFDPLGFASGDRMHTL